MSHSKVCTLLTGKSKEGIFIPRKIIKELMISILNNVDKL